MPRTTAPTGFFLAFVIALMLFATTPVAAGDYEDGLAAYHAGDYQKALRLWEPLAKQGYSDTQYNLGVMYSQGKGVPEDDAKAVHWWTKAAKQGDAEAQLHLGLIYYKGQGVPKDDAKAAHWWTKAANQGDARRRSSILVGCTTPGQR